MANRSVIRVALFAIFCAIVNGQTTTNLQPIREISAVLNHLRANPVTIYTYKDGTVLNAHKKGDITELTVDIEVDCSNTYPEVPCNEKNLICNAFLASDGQILGTVSCKPRPQIVVDDYVPPSSMMTTTVNDAPSVLRPSLSSEGVSSEGPGEQFVAVRKEHFPCLGCPFDLNPQAQGVDELVDLAVRHIESEKNAKHQALRVLRLQQQVVAGIKYIMLMEVAPSGCIPDPTSDSCPAENRLGPMTCEIVYVQRPWIGRAKHIVLNNCTSSQEFFLPDPVNDDMDNEIDISGKRVKPFPDPYRPNFDRIADRGNIDDMNPIRLADLESQIVVEEDDSPRMVDTSTTVKQAADLPIIDVFVLPDSSPRVVASSPTLWENPLEDKPSSVVGTDDTRDVSGDTGCDSTYSTTESTQVDSSSSSTDQDESSSPPQSQSRRKRETVVGGQQPIDTNNSNIQEFLRESVQHLDSKSDHSNRYKPIEVESATSQVVAGSLYRINVKISLSDCAKGDSKSLDDCPTLTGSPVKQCEVKVWDRPWLKQHETTIKCDGDEERKFTTLTSTRRRRALGGNKRLLGAAEEVAKDDKDLLEYLDGGLAHLEVEISLDKKLKIEEVLEVSRQLVSGTLHRVKAKVVLTDCQKNDVKKRSSCGTLEGAKASICDFTIWDQPWLPNGRQTNITCDDDNQLRSYRSKRAVIYHHDPHLLGKDDHDVQYSMFHHFIDTHNKFYASAKEYKYRFRVFRDNLKFIRMLNKNEQGTAKYGVTKFADLTQKEFSKSLGLRSDLRSDNAAPLTQAEIPQDLGDLPVEFDWRTKGAVSEVKDQGQCGSCWAFSVTGNVEGQYALKYGKLLEFSEQELVDCDSEDKGCNGGLMNVAYDQIERLGGLETEQDYPYDAEDERCHFNTSLVQVQVSGGLNISSDEVDMQKWLIQNGPISIAINANAMQFYMGGVSHPFKFLCNPKSLDHGVLIVGYGVHKYSLFNKTLPYWIVKNSWGPSWGEQGYYRVYRGDGTCGVNQTPSSAILV